MPAPRGLGFVIKSRFDVDHARDKVIKRSRIWFLIYMNSVTGGVLRDNIKSIFKTLFLLDPDILVRIKLKKYLH